MEKIEALLWRCGLHPAALDLQTLSQSVLGQMRIALYGGKSSIPMRPTYLPPFPAENPTGSVALTLCTETTFCSARVRMEDAGEAVTQGERFPLPGLDYPAPLEDLLFGAVSLAEAFLAEARCFVLVLPFPLRYTEAGAVYLASAPEPLRLSGWEDCELCAALREQLTELGFPDLPVKVLGTVSAAQVAAAKLVPAQSRYLSLYWGERFNAGFALPTSAILKLKRGENSLQLLDCGAGGFVGFPFASLDLIMDRDAAKPGEDLMDKSVALRHLGEQFRFAMIKAVETNLLSFMCGRDLLSLRTLSVEAVLTFLANPDGEGRLADFCRHEAGDREVALCIAQAVIDRALRLIGAQMGAILLLSGAGNKADSPACMVLSGEGFVDERLRKRFAECILPALTEQLGLHLTLCYDPQAPYLGAALLT